MTPEVPTTSKLTFYDACSLYSNILCMELPVDDFQIMDTRRNPRLFNFYCRKIFDHDTQFFAEQKVYFNYAFFCVVEQDFDIPASVYTTLDVSAFPQRRQIDPSEISFYQRQSFHKQGKKVPKNTRLVSSCQRGIVGEWLDNIFLMSTLQGGFLRKIVKIVRCRAFPIFRPYIVKLNEARGNEPSNVQGRILKGLSNTLAGKMHQSIAKRLKTIVVTDEARFQKILDRDNFYDVLPLGKSKAIGMGIYLQGTHFPQNILRFFHRQFGLCLYNGLSKSGQPRVAFDILENLLAIKGRRISYLLLRRGQRGPYQRRRLALPPLGHRLSRPRHGTSDVHPRKMASSFIILGSRKPRFVPAD